MRGPIPQPSRRRRNAPTIPTTCLPAEGRQAPPPPKPSWLRLGKAGRAWWRWAWGTPQAAAWAAGHEVVVARRAVLEDELVRCRDAGDPVPSALLQRMTDLEDRLGLSPKAMAQLRWTIGSDVEAHAPSAVVESAGNVVTPDRWRRASAG